ncbi:hypothetical protein CVO96_14415 [Deinococcus koreensis]|uniref:Uncharacterized protein n=1 Tax=Deinococcus koreensis TaxID=2054903 RepID=A0A2K3V0S6_9DEIO|nr:hypothetical protein CVO96_14415 [Deinococcus koreensis]
MTIKRIYSKTTGELKSIDSVFQLVQPNLSFATAAGSVGARLVSADVTILDESGNRYGDVSGQYTQSIGARLLQGFACADEKGVPNASADPESCVFAQRIQYSRQQIFPGANNASAVQLLTPRIGEVATGDCIAGPCPANLSMNVTFHLVDDLQRNQTIQVKRAPIPVYRISDTRSEE